MILFINCCVHNLVNIARIKHSDNEMRRYKSLKDLKIIGNNNNSKMQNQNNSKRSGSMLNACISLGNPFDEVGKK